LNPYLILGAVVAAAVLAGGSYFAGVHHESVVFDAYKSQQAAVAAQQVTSNHDAVAAVSASEAAGLRQIADTAKESAAEIQKRNDALVAANASLADQLRHRLTSPRVVTAGVSKAGTGTGSTDGSSDAALSVGLADLVKFNTAQFYAADNDTVTITGLQSVVTQDRQICNGALPGLPQSN
jgi:hypothetical protein